jgi:hypothetical protein
VARGARRDQPAVARRRPRRSGRHQLSLDAGLADPDGPSNTKIFVGGNYGRQLTRATKDQPLDLLFTAGLGLAAGDGPDVIRIPVGLSVGHRFPLEGGMAITPYVHPRISFDSYTGDRDEGGDRHRLTLDFDLGGSLEITPQLALRASVLFSGGDGGTDTGIGVGLTFTPRGLKHCGGQGPRAKPSPSALEMRHPERSEGSACGRAPSLFTSGPFVAAVLRVTRLSSA